MKKEVDPRMHSAEHILNQTMVRMFDCGRSFNAHIEKKKSKCDYRLNRALTEEELSEVTNRINQIITADLPISEEFLTQAEAREHYDLGKLPADASDTVRIVKVGDYDACPCIGIHVDSTSKIGNFRIVSASFENEIVRIRFKLQQPAIE